MRKPRGYEFGVPYPPLFGFEAKGAMLPYIQSVDVLTHAWSCFIVFDGIMKQADLDDEPAVPVEGVYDDDGERVEGEEDEEEEEKEEEEDDDLGGDEDEDGDQDLDGGGQEVLARGEEEEEDEDGEIDSRLEDY